MPLEALDVEDLIAAFEDQTNALGVEHLGEWVVLGSELQRFVSFREAAEYATHLAPPYSIRQIGTTTIAAQGSALYEGASAVREPKGCTVGAASLLQDGVAIGVHVGFTREVSWNGSYAGLFAGPPLRAVIDTGGHHSAIDERLAMRAGLPCINRGNVVGATGESSQNFYLAQLYFPNHDWLVVEQMVGVSLGEGQQLIHLGRPFLNHVTLLVDGATGSYALKRSRTE
jgi:hypothetical protein